MVQPVIKLMKASLCTLAAVGVLGVGTHARATVVERIVALVGDQAIFLSDLKSRARPLLLRIHAETPEGAQRSAAISQVYGSVLERMVDEELQQRAASQQHVGVTPQEIDAALERLASGNSISVEDVIAEAARSGLSVVEYRQEIRRQLLEAKLLNQRIQGRLRFTRADLEAAYQKLQKEERATLGFRAAWIRLDAPADVQTSANAQRLAAQLSRQARAGADFAALARTHSHDEATRAQGGALPATEPGQLAPSVDRALVSLDTGQVSEPLKIGDSWVVLKVLERQPSQLPPFEEAQAELQNRVYVETVNVERKRWLDGLRRQTHVELRL